MIHTSEIDFLGFISDIGFHLERGETEFHYKFVYQSRISGDPVIGDSLIEKTKAIGICIDEQLESVKISD